MTLKTILKNFLNYADTLDAQKKLGKDIYEVDFQKLKSLTEELKRDKDYSTSEGLKEVNRRKNRYKDILPYDYTRVILSEYPGVPGSDYINANYIKGASGSLAYIASQGPLPNTVVDFWRMIWECEVQVIVMACNEQESGKYKCECYWPTDEEKKQYGNINVEFVKWRQVCPDFLVRTLKACWESEERVICQFHYTTWPDHGVPTSVQPILELVRLIRDCQASEAVPVLIHCSAGCGRTGTICAIDYVWGLMRMGKLTKHFNLYNVIADMRRQRIAMVQTKEQYVLVHKAVSSLFEQQLRVIDSHTYENLDEDGEPLILKELNQQEEDIYEDILEPPLLDEQFNLSDKLVDRKIQPSNTFHDYGNKDVPPIPSKRDPCPENLLNFSKNIVYKPDMNDRLLSDHSYDHCDTRNLYDQKESVVHNMSTKKEESEYELPYTRNSQTLMKLCREESVKRLIFDWNKVVGQSDDMKNVNREIALDHACNTKTPVAKHLSDKVMNDQKPISNQDKRDLSFSMKTENAVQSSKQKFETESDPSSSDTLLKNSSPEDIHAGKLVGKATVIRRPSIAKLKALFEKSPQNNSESNENNRRRTLFRSHSHYVSNSSRAFTLTDSTNQHNEANSMSASKAEESRFERNKNSTPSNVDNAHTQNSENSSHLHSNSSSQSFSFNDNRQPFHTPEDRKHTQRTNHMPSCELNRTAPQNILDLTINRSVTSDSYSNSNDSSNVNAKIKQSTPSSKKDKPPELPAKKKPAVPLPQVSYASEKNSKDVEVTVPRFVVNLPKESVYSEPSNRVITNVTPKETSSNKSSTPAGKSNSENVPSKASVASPDWNSDDSLREFTKRSQDVERRVLCKNQSFSDPEQSNRCLDQSTKQTAKPKLSLTDQTYPKLTYSVEKGLNERIGFSYECAYMNVNSLAQKNIRQIEEKIKTHPRGAIIDLTSRKSYIDETNPPTDRQYVFRNTVEPVKFLPRQESKDLISVDKSISKTENSMKDPSVKTPSTVTHSKSSSSKSDATNTESDLINSKNLLLHSPPPKSKRGHLSKSNSKTPPTATTTKVLNDVPDSSKNVPSSTDKANTPKPVTTSSSTTANMPQNSNVSSSSSIPAADRSDPRYFPVNRQTASDAKYESEKHKAESREAASGRPTSTYEPHYSSKPINAVYHKLPLSYEKSNPETKMLKDVKYTHDKSHYDKEPIYGLQRSTSGPQILPSTSDTSQKLNHPTDMNRSYNIYGQITEESKTNKSFHSPDTRAIPHYDPTQSYSIYGTTGQHNAFPPGPPKPPRTFHYDTKGNQESTTDYKSEHTVKRDGGRYIVSVASPKHSNTQNSLQSSNDYRYERLQDANHIPSKNVYPPQPTYVSPLTNEVHMSRSYPFSNYDRNYYPRPYGKQYYPESIAFRNVQPVHVTNNIYGVPEKPSYTHQNIYGTIKHRSTYADYENVYDAQVDYMRAMSNPKNEHSKVYQNPNSMQYTHSDASMYGVIQPPKSHSQFDQKMQSNVQREFKNFGDNSVPKRVYFDTLQRRNKQVTWEQRRSHDDMDIRPAPSARLREQIHARRSMVELDNLEISVASDEGYPDKVVVETLASPGSHAKLLHLRNERHPDAAQSKSPHETNDTSKDYHKKSSVHSKEPASFGETLSKAFGKLTSFTKFNAKDGQTASAGPSDSSNAITKVESQYGSNCVFGSAGKQKDKDKHNNFTVQSPVSKESPSEQWTQV